MITLVPGGTSGVALKSNISWGYTWADSLGFTLEFRKIFRVRTDCGMIRSHSYAVNLVSVLYKPKQYILQALLAHSVAFSLWMCGGTN